MPQTTATRCAKPTERLLASRDSLLRTAYSISVTTTTSGEGCSIVSTNTVSATEP